MDIISNAIMLALQMVPLYITVALGFAAGRVMELDGKTLANVNLHIMAPIVLCVGVIEAQVSTKYLLLPFITLMICTILSLLTWVVAKRIWSDNQANLVAFSSGVSNAASFSLPIAMLIFDEATVGVFIVTFIGMTLFRSSIGHAIAMKGEEPFHKCLLICFKLPTFYAVLLGFVLSLQGAHVPVLLGGFVDNMRGAFIIVSMLLIGISIGSSKKLGAEPKFISIIFFVKFLVWPCVALALIQLDTQVLHWFDRPVYQSFLLLAISPVAINTVIMAHIIGAPADKAAFTVLCSTVFSLVYIPLMIAWLVI